MKHLKRRLIVLLLVLTAVASCKKGPTNPPTIDLSQVLINDFKLEETVYSNITITHPVIANGVEIQWGAISVTIPMGNTGRQLTPKTENFTNTDFTVSPQLGTKQNFSNTIIYTISSRHDASKQVHYTVTIAEEQPVPTQTALTTFTFEKAKNPLLPADITSSRIIEGNGSIGKVFIFVPAGTSFSSLTPTIGYQGTSLFYSLNTTEVPENSTTAYPAAGMPVDFTYPKVFYAIVKNGGEVKTYNVIVDVKAPIRFDNNAITVPDVKVGASHFIKTTTLLNQGNHPITIVRVDHSNYLPSWATAVRGSGFIPSGGLLSKVRGDVFATISAQTYPAGTYQVKATFQPRFVNHTEADDLLESTPLYITSTIVQ